MWPCLGWIVAALLLGYLLGSHARKEPGLRKRSGRIAVYRGRSGLEITELLGGPAQETTVLQDGHVLRTWRGEGYAITLRFDGKDVCQGVYDECG